MQDKDFDMRLNLAECPVKVAEIVEKTIRAVYPHYYPSEYYPSWEPPVSCLRATRKFLASEPSRIQDIVVLPLLVSKLTEAAFNFSI